MKILANVFEHFIKLGAVNPFQLKVNAHILNELLKVGVLLAKLVYGLSIQKGFATGRKQDKSAVNIL